MKIKAFTLIEVLVVISIILILSVAGISLAGNSNETVVAAQTVQNIASDVESLKFKAISGVAHNSQLVDWGVKIDCSVDSNKYVLGAFDRGTNTLISGSSTTKTLAGEFFFTESNDPNSPSSCGSTLTFKRLNGTATHFLSDGTVSTDPVAITVTNLQGTAKKINISSSGNVSYDNTLTSLPSRTTRMITCNAPKVEPRSMLLPELPRWQWSLSSEGRSNCIKLQGWRSYDGGVSYTLYPADTPRYPPGEFACYDLRKPNGTVSFYRNPPGATACFKLEQTCSGGLTGWSSPVCQ